MLAAKHSLEAAWARAAVGRAVLGRCRVGRVDDRALRSRGSLDVWQERLITSGRHAGWVRSVRPHRVRADGPCARDRRQWKTVEPRRWSREAGFGVKGRARTGS